MNFLKKIKDITKKNIGEDNFFKLKLIKLEHLHNRELRRIIREEKRREEKRREEKRREEKRREEKKKINILFFIMHHAVWKYDKIYQLFSNDNRFNPTILICPYTYYGDEVMKNDMNESYIFFKQKGYNVVKSLKENNTWLDVRKELQPDIIFWANPHFITKPNYYIFDLKDILGCYVPYNFGNSHLLEMFHNQQFHNLLWKLFAETEIHKEYSVKTAINKGKNVIVTGYPGTDIFLEKQEISYQNFWKHKNTKKIIWAPHHTIDDDKEFISFSSFNLYYEKIFSLLDKYKGQIEIIFKPHPLLKLKLYDSDDWGKEKTDEYYRCWEEHPYGGLSLGDYVGLFLSSDAMIHDSGSFLIEYLYTEKPVLRTDRDDTITNRLNSFGKMAYDVHYIAKNSNDIEKFLEMIIHNQEDKLKEKRIAFKKKHLLPPNGKTASENIYNYIKSQLKLK